MYTKKNVSTKCSTHHQYLRNQEKDNDNTEKYIGKVDAELLIFIVYSDTFVGAKQT